MKLTVAGCGDAFGTPIVAQHVKKVLAIEPGETARHAVIWLHGLGADGHDFPPIVPELHLAPALAMLRTESVRAEVRALPADQVAFAL